MNDYIDIIDDDDSEEFDDFFYRNARPALRRRPGRAMMRPRPMQATAFVRRPPPSRAPVVNSKYGSLKWGLLADVAAKTLGAIQPLPAPPTMGDDPMKNQQNQTAYVAAIAGHFKAVNQLHTLGAALKVILP